MKQIYLTEQQLARLLLMETSQILCEIFDKDMNMKTVKMIIKKLLKKGGRIIQKTDDRDFFEFSLEEYEACGFTLENKTYNLHENGNPDWNVVTEYEAKWVERGLPIHRVEAKI